jgi:hypothetical protein
MTDQQPTTEQEPTTPEGEPTTGPASNPPPPGESPLGAARAASEDDRFAERPEAFVGAAFAGGLALALIMRRLTR